LPRRRKRRHLGSVVSRPPPGGGPPAGARRLLSADSAPNGHIPSRGGVRSNPSRAAYVPRFCCEPRREIESPGIFIWVHVVSFFACGGDSHRCREKRSRQPDRRAGHEARFFTVVPVRALPLLAPLVLYATPRPQRALTEHWQWQAGSGGTVRGSTTNGGPEGAQGANRREARTPPAIARPRARWVTSRPSDGEHWQPSVRTAAGGSPVDNQRVEFKAAVAAAPLGRKTPPGWCRAVRQPGSTNY
jgi:hypothetical protein